MILDLANYAFTNRDYKKPQTIDQNEIIMQIKKGPVPYGVNNTEMCKENNKFRNQTSEY